MSQMIKRQMTIRLNVWDQLSWRKKTTSTEDRTNDHLITNPLLYLLSKQGEHFVYIRHIGISKFQNILYASSYVILWNITLKILKLNVETWRFLIWKFFIIVYDIYTIFDDNYIIFYKDLSMCIHYVYNIKMIHRYSRYSLKNVWMLKR